MLACSAIVCTRYRGALLGRCLESLAGLDHPRYEVVVVDNSPGDPEVQRLASEAGARYVHEPRRGLSRARNTGSEAAAGDLVAFLDDDAIADRSWLSAHSAVLADSPLMATTGRILPISGRDGPEADRARVLDLGVTPFRVDSETPSWFEIASFGGLGFGGNMVFKRELFARGFRFSERLGLGARLDWGEEFYAFFSIIADGHAIAYVPQAVVRHDPAPTTSARLSRLRRRSAAYMLMLWLEEKPFRRNVAAYALESLKRRRPPWRRTEAEVPPANRLQMLGAALGGSILYLRSRRNK